MFSGAQLQKNNSYKLIILENQLGLPYILSYVRGDITEIQDFTVSLFFKQKYGHKDRKNKPHDEKYIVFISAHCVFDHPGYETRRRKP